jgi:uncharacterized protein (DUF779 family)
VVATAAALILIARLRERHGGLMFVLSHGCCDGSTPMCLVQGEMQLGVDDLKFGEVGGVPFHISRSQLDYLQGTQLTLDVAPGSQGSFSLEDAEGLHFVTRSRLWSDAESRLLDALPGAGTGTHADTSARADS